MTAFRRSARWGSVAVIALFMATMLNGEASGVPDQPNAMGGATITPDTQLHTGDTVSVTIAGFPANSIVAAVQCDRRILTTGDSGYCGTQNLGLLLTDLDGGGAGFFAVLSDSSFSSSNGDGVCDARHYCVIAFQSQGPGVPTTEAVAPMWFGSKSATEVRAPRSRRQNELVQVSVTVTNRATDTATLTAGPPGGRVFLRDGRKLVANGTLPASGEAEFNIKLSPGRHRLAVRYSGDRHYLPSSDRVIVRIHRHR